MTLLKIYNLETTNEVDVVSTLPEGEHIIGRGVILNCNDKRVSRKHALIHVGKDVVTIKAVHINPCFFKAANGNSVTILPKDTSIVLNDGDQFALLADIFWFKVKIIWNDTSDTVHITKDNLNPIENTSDARNNDNGCKLDDSNVSIYTDSNAPSTSKRNYDEESSVNTKRTKISYKNENDLQTNLSDENRNCNENTTSRPTSPSNLNLLDDTSQNIRGCDGVKEEHRGTNIDSEKLKNNLRSILEEDYGNKSEENEKQKEVSDGKNAIADSNRNMACNTGTEIKKEVLDESIKLKQEELVSSEIENSKNNEEQSGNSNPLQIDKIKEEPNEYALKSKENDSTSAKDNENKPSCSTDDQNKTKIRRERCWYGPNCYRKNPLHQADFSHPGDNDYDSDPDDDRPECPFGNVCYRKNLEHRRQFKHSNPPAPKPNNGDGKPKRKRKSPKKHSQTDDSQQGDDDDNSTGRKRRAATKKQPKYCDTPEDDYDYNDPFIDDASSDEFELSSDEDDDDDSDWEDSQEVDEESQEIRRLKKEAKKFTKPKGKKND